MWAFTLQHTQLRSLLISSIIALSSFATRYRFLPHLKPIFNQLNQRSLRCFFTTQSNITERSDDETLQYDTEKFMKLLRTPPSSPDPYPLWARDKNSLLMWHDIHLKKGHGRDYNFSFPLLSLFQKTTTSSETSLSEDSLQAFISLSERFAQNKIDTIIQHFSPWAAAVLEGWCEHCVRRGICWTLEDVVPLHSKITGVGSFFYNPSRNKEIEEYVQKTYRNSTIGVYVPPLMSKIIQYSGFNNLLEFQYLIQKIEYLRIFFVFWAQIECRQKFTLTDTSNGKILFEDNGIYNHVWKFGTELPSPLNSDVELCWKVLDFDYIVQERAYQIQTEERVWVDSNTYPHEILWQQGVI